MPERFVIASNNLAKTQELIQIFAYYNITAISYRKLINKVKFPPEGDKNYVENAKQKAEFIVKRLPQEWVVADDSGMLLAAHPNELRVLTARQLAPYAHTEEQLNNRILAMVNGRSRQVQMVTWLVLNSPTQQYIAKGDFKGTISDRPQGNNGRSFDLILVPDGLQTTLAQLTDEKKIPLLHRAKAVQHLLSQLKE